VPTQRVDAILVHVEKFSKGPRISLLTGCDEPNICLNIQNEALKLSEQFTIVTHLETGRTKR
jgi:hypothetical protein